MFGTEGLYPSGVFIPHCPSPSLKPGAFSNETHLIPSFFAMSVTGPPICDNTVTLQFNFIKLFANSKTYNSEPVKFLNEIQDNNTFNLLLTSKGIFDGKFFPYF